MADLSAPDLENKRLSWAGLGHVREITLPNIAWRRGWVSKDDEQFWEVSAAFVPEAIRHHRTRFLKETAVKLELLYADRWRLNEALWRGDGKLHEAVPHMLRRRAKKYGAGKRRLSDQEVWENQRAADEDPFDTRRPDLLLDVFRVVMIFVAFCDYKTWFLFDPQRPGYPLELGTRPGKPPPGRKKREVRGIAELAGVGYEATKDALDWLELWGFIDFTKRNVERKVGLDGKTRFVTMRPSWRRFRFDRWIAQFGGPMYREAFLNTGKTEPKRKRAADAPALPEEADMPKRDPRLVQAIESVFRAWDARPSKPAPKGTPYDAMTYAQKKALWDAVEADHPDWKDFPRIVEEAKRRAAAPPNAEGAAEPETSDSAE